MSFEIAKAGWLFRQSSVLHRWKKNWFVLYTNGVLKYFDSPDSTVAEECVFMPTKCQLLKKQTQVSGVTPPPGLTTECLIAIVLSDQSWILCADSLDDMTTWYMSLEQARVRSQGESVAPPYNPPPYGAPPMYSSGPAYPPAAGVYTGYPSPQLPPYGYTQQQAYYGNQPPQYVVEQQAGGPGTTTVVFVDEPNRYYYDRRDGCYDRRYGGGDVAMGVVAGAALGSMMWGPMLWW